MMCVGGMCPKYSKILFMCVYYSVEVVELHAYTGVSGIWGDCSGCSFAGGPVHGREPC